MYEPTYLGEIELSEDTLAHYGVKGMRWRRRKNRQVLGKRNSTVNGKRMTRTDASGKHYMLGDNGHGEVFWANKKLRQVSSNRPVARRRNVTGSGSGAYRKGSGLGSGAVGSRSSVTRSPGLGYSQVTGGNGSIGLTLSGGYSQVTNPKPVKGGKRRKKRVKG